MNSPLRAVIQADVEDGIKFILRTAVDPWMFYNARGARIDIPRVDGTRISLKGFDYSGSVMDTFWDGFVDAYILKIGRDAVETTRKRAIERGIPMAPALLECQASLDDLVRRVYERMALIDQRLRGKGYPKSVTKRNVRPYIDREQRKLHQYIQSEIDCVSVRPTPTRNWLDALELKPNFLGFGLNLNFLIDWLRQRSCHPESNNHPA